MKHFKSLDAFRGLAAIMIVIFHSQFYVSTTPDPLVRYSFYFVDFFFILSGFVMSYAYEDRILGKMAFGKFLVDRFARLYPLHLVTLLIWVPFVAIKFYLYWYGSEGSDPAEIFNLFTFVQNLLLLQGFTSETSWNYPSWSIGVEFFTYIVFYAAVRFLSRLSERGRYTVYAAIVLGAYLVLENYEGDLYGMHYMLRCVSGYFLGVLLYALYRYTHFSVTNIIFATVLELVVLMLMLYCVSHIDVNSEYRHYTLFLFAMIVYLFAIEERGYLSRVLMTGFFQYLGRISYSIYMTHAIVVAVAHKAAGYLLQPQAVGVAGNPKGLVMEHAFLLNLLLLLVVMGLSTWTYRYVEIPGQSYLKRRFSKHDK